MGAERNAHGNFEADGHLWQELLVSMIFGGKPLEAAQRLLTYEWDMADHYEQQIIEALGICEHTDALAALILLEEHCKVQRLERVWFAAISKIDGIDASDYLLTSILELQQSGACS